MVAYRVEVRVTFVTVGGGNLDGPAQRVDLRRSGEQQVSELGLWLACKG